MTNPPGLRSGFVAPQAFPAQPAGDGCVGAPSSFQGKIQLQERSAFSAPRKPERRAAHILARKRLAEQVAMHSDSDSCESISSDNSTGLGKIFNSSRRRVRRKQDGSTICSSGLSDIPLPGSGPNLQEVLAIRRTNGMEEYLIKLKGRPYSKARWWSRDESYSTLNEVKLENRVKQYLSERNVKPMADYEPEGEPYPQQYNEMDRLLNVAHETGKALVSWKGLPLSEATWEPLEEVTGEVLEAFDGFKSKRPVTPKQVATLYSYQRVGVDWLKDRFRTKKGGILADDMGLGKTIQTILFLNELYAEDPRNSGGPHLLIVPLTVIAQWETELSKWCTLQWVSYFGKADSRRIAADYLIVSQGKIQPHIVLTTYEIVSRDRDIGFLSRHWSVVVFDEAHKVKSSESQIWGVASKLRSKCKLLLTGTPVQNNTEELWSLLHICDPKEFAVDARTQFVTALELPSVSASLRRIKDSITPYILRRVKSEVLKDLPQRSDTHIKINMTGFQRMIYKNIMEKNHDFLYAANGNRRVSARNICTQMRSVCNHPYLIDGMRELYENSYMQSAASSHLPPVIASSGKAIVLDKILMKWRSEKRKVLIFSQWKLILNIIEECISFRGWTFVRLDGSVTGENRQRAINSFNSDSQDPFIFLLTTRAGGVGLNLTTATRVIIHDTDWNPQQDLQAAARTHRIGQQKEVKIYRLVSLNTFEELMVQAASRKLALSASLLTNDFAGSTDEELKDLLKKGAYSMMSQNAQPSDELLFNSTAQQILGTAEAASGTTDVVKDISNFSEVTVTHTTDHEDNDTAYWNNVVKLRGTPPPESPSPIFVREERKAARKRLQQESPALVELSFSRTRSKPVDHTGDHSEQPKRSKTSKRSVELSFAKKSSPTPPRVSTTPIELVFTKKRPKMDENEERGDKTADKKKKIQIRKKKD